MPRAAPPLTVASLALLVALCAGPASASQTVTKVDGEIRALAFSGDALVVARVPPGRGLVLERVVPGSPTQAILTTAFDDEDDEVALAASPQAVALGLKPDVTDGLGPGSVMVGPPGGPLREVATCTTGVIASPVAVAGARVAWREGGCGEPQSTPSTVTPSAIAVGGVAAGTPVRKTPVNGLPVALLLAAGDTGIAGVWHPSFFGIDSELLPFSPAGLGAAITTERTRALLPVGILADGTRVGVLGSVDGDDQCETREVFTIAPGATARRPVPLGGCPVAERAPGPQTSGGPLAAGDRILALVGTGEDAVTLVSMRGDGGDRRKLVSGTYRRPSGFAADGDRVAWWHPHCTGGGEIVVQQGPEPRVRLTSCRAEIVTHRARARAGKVALRLRCPDGCTGAITGRLATPREFSFDPGTHVVRVPVSLGRSRSARVHLDVFVAHGPIRSATVTVRR